MNKEEFTIGKGCTIANNVIIGHPCKDNVVGISVVNKVKIGDNAIIRSGTIIYSDVKIGNDFKTGHNVVIRECTDIGNNVLIGTNTVIDGHTKIGNNVSIQSNVYIPTDVIIEDNVFIGPCSVLTNDKYPIRKGSKSRREPKIRELKGPILRKGATIGANSTILPGVEIGEGSMIAAGAVVTNNVPPWRLAIGVPANIIDLPDGLKMINII